MKTIDCSFINYYCELTYNASAKHMLVTIIESSLIAKIELGP
jgi:hypothetical protein